MSDLKRQLQDLIQTLAALDLPGGEEVTLRLEAVEITVVAEHTPYQNLNSGTERGQRTRYSITLSRPERDVQAGAHVDPEPDGTRPEA